MKKLIQLLEISTSEFRTKIKGLGYSEKGGELTSGGDLNPQFLDILSSVLDEWKKSNPNCPLKFTSGNDKFHKTRKSLHTVGLAVDVTLDNSCKSKFLSLLNSYKQKYNGFSYIDEYSNPSPGATGGHIHISFRTGKPEGGGVEYSSSESGGESVSGFDARTSASNIFNSSLSSLANMVSKPATAAVSESRLDRDINKIRELLK